MIISNESIEAIEYITKIYPCFKSPDDVIRGMLRDFARNTDNDVIIDMLKTKTCKKIELLANDMENTIDSLKKDIDSYYE